MARSGGRFPEPVFIGGSARSGTHAVGRLIAAHPRYHLIATEARFHCFREGLPDLLAGRVEMGRFLELCRGHWWRRGFRNAQGLHRIAGRGQRERALARFEEDFERDPWSASRELVEAILGPAVERDGATSWVEVSGWNVQNAPTLWRLFPDARFVNMVRDGRAVVAGHLRKKSLTDDPLEALDHWQRRIRSAHAAIRELPADRILVVGLEDLVARDRERTYRRLVEFLGVDDDRALRRFFESEISPEAAHHGRWRERMPPPEARLIDRRYRRVVRQLRREGISWVPAPDEAGISLGPLRIRPPWRASL